MATCSSCATKRPQEYEPGTEKRGFAVQFEALGPCAYTIKLFQAVNRSALGWPSSYYTLVAFKTSSRPLATASESIRFIPLQLAMVMLLNCDPQPVRFITSP